MPYIQYAFKGEIINCKQQSYNYHNKYVTSSKVVNGNEFPGKKIINLELDIGVVLKR